MRGVCVLLDQERLGLGISDDAVCEDGMNSWGQVL